MEKENKVFTLVLVSLISAAAAFALVFAVTIGVQAANAPILAYLKEIRQEQSASTGMNPVFEARLAALEKDMNTLKTALGPVLDPERQARQPNARPPEEDMNKVYDLPDGTSAVLGSRTAPVVVTVFMDYQCPFCSKFYPAAHEAQKAYPDKVRLVVKHYPLPFHAMARSSSKAALAAGEQGKFFEMTSEILKNNENLSDEKFKQLAGQIGLDVNRFLRDLKDKDADYNKVLTADMELVKKSDVRGTPTFYLNGKKTNARTADEWRAEIEALLKK